MNSVKSNFQFHHCIIPFFGSAREIGAIFILHTKLHFTSVIADVFIAVLSTNISSIVLLCFFNCKYTSTYITMITEIQQQLWSDIFLWQHKVLPNFPCVPQAVPLNHCLQLKLCICNFINVIVFSSVHNSTYEKYKMTKWCEAAKTVNAIKHIQKYKFVLILWQWLITSRQWLRSFSHTRKKKTKKKKKYATLCM